MLNKKHYKAIADCIDGVCLMACEPDGGTIGTPERREALRAGADIARHQIANWLADYFKQDNPLFDRQKFYDACFKD